MTNPRTKPFLLFSGFGLLIIMLQLSCQYFSINKPDHPTTTKNILMKGAILARRSPTKAIAYLDQAYLGIKNPGPEDKYLKLSFKRELYADSLADYDAALNCSDSLLSVLKPQTRSDAYRLKYAEEFLAKGDILFKMRLFNEAYAAYFDGRTAMEASTDSCNRSRFFFLFSRRLADISYGKGSFLESANWQKKALYSLEKCNRSAADDYLRQGALDNVALSYLFAEKTDSALTYFNKALAVVSAMKAGRLHSAKELDEAKGVILGNRGTLFLKLNRLSAAEADLNESIRINSQAGYANEDALITRMKLAELFLKRGQLQAAGSQLALIDPKAFRRSNPLIRQQFTLISANYAAAIGQTASANHLFQQYIATGDSLKRLNKTLFSTDFSKEFELLKKQYDLTVLNRQNEWQDIYLLGAAIIGIFAAVVIYLVIRNSRQARRSAQLSAAHNVQLETALSALEKSNLENAQLLSVVAHDLKNPIGAIYGISGLMLEDKRNKEDTELLELIKTSSQHLNQLVYDILAARLQSETIKAETINNSLNELLQECVDLLQYHAREKKQKIVMSKADDVFVVVNKSAVWRVANNLIINAIKFSPSHTTIDISWTVANGQAVVSITDQGIGIPPDLKGKIFQLATEAKRTGTAGEETFGLGLYISRKLIQDLGGELWLAEGSGKGSTFCFSLPVSAA